MMSFPPVCYKNGIVFCSNRSATKVLNYANENNKGFVKINFVDSIDNGQPQNVKYFSKKLNTKFNDGPVTFNSKGDTMFFFSESINRWENIRTFECKK